jgi:uncharacterized membrane protein YhaH (DUF805 family)
MEIGLSGPGFGKLLILLGLVSLIIVFGIFAIARRRGVDTNTHRFGLTVAFSCLILFVLIPLWLTDISTKWKIIATVLVIGVGVFNYFGISQQQKRAKEKADRKTGRGGGPIEP